MAVGLESLPEELFRLITQHLDAVDIILCRSVSKTWHTAFANPSFLRTAIITHLGYAREVQRLKCEGPAENTGRDSAYWMHIFDRVAAHYHALKNGKPFYITKLSQYVGERPAHLCPITHFFEDVYKSALVRYAEYHRLDREQAWTYDDGLLVYADKESKGYVLLDIEDTTKTNVPFELKGRYIRQIRLCNQVLLIEWAEDTPYHSDSEPVHRHFVTAFDVVPVPKSLPWLPKWSVTYRNEWKLHFLGLPLSYKDRFFSVHTATHYAVYFWQLPRPSLEGSTAVELLTVWDISQHCDYRPSDDPSGQGKPEFGPRVMFKASNELLSFYGIRQKNCPSFQRLRLDEGEGMVYFQGEAGLTASGRLGKGKYPSWTYSGCVVGIPISGIGPAWRSEVYQKWRASSKKRPATLIRGFPNNETSIDPIKAYEYSRCEEFMWTFHGGELRGYRDCAAGINFVAGQPDQHRPKHPVDWIIHIWGDDWKAKVEQNAVDCLKFSRIRGDERWIIGRNKLSNEIVILHFDRKSSTGMHPVALCSTESTADTN